MEEFPKLKRYLWLGKLWARGYYVGTSGDSVTADQTREYIRYRQNQGRQLILFAKGSSKKTAK